MNGTEPGDPSPGARHPEEMKANVELRIGSNVVLEAHARTTPAGIVCTGLALAMTTFALGYLLRSRLPHGGRRSGGVWV